MDYLFLIVSGAVIGVIVAAPIGPVNLICIRRTLAFGPLHGFLSGLGAALGDGIFAIITAFGLTAIAQLIEGYSTPLQIIGGVMLLGFGWHTFHADPRCVSDNAGAPAKDASSLSFPARVVRDVFSTLALTLTNPATMLGFAALFAGLGSIVDEKASFLAAAVTVGGVVAGSAGWWFLITTVTAIFHKRIDSTIMRRVNQISGVVVAAFGLAVLGHLVMVHFG
jgi:threonine/homoserine/homoserine lactone efflux protein